MTKVGEGKDLPKPPSIEVYQDQLDTNATKFINALDAYNEADPDERTHFKSVMDDSLAMIRSAVSEIKRPGIAKQENRVEKDYKAYMQNESPENFSKLSEDLYTLRDYNKNV